MHIGYRHRLFEIVFELSLAVQFVCKLTARSLRCPASSMVATQVLLPFFLGLESLLCVYPSPEIRQTTTYRDSVSPFGGNFIPGLSPADAAPGRRDPSDRGPIGSPYETRCSGTEKSALRTISSMASNEQSLYSRFTSTIIFSALYYSITSARPPPIFVTSICDPTA